MTTNSKISTFPKFTRLKIDHRDQINSIIGHLEPYADFAFVNLYSWSIDDETEVALLNGNLVIKLPDYITGLSKYSIIGEYEIEESIKQMMTFTESIKFVPKLLVDQLDPTSNNYVIEEDEDSNDYIYNLEKLSVLSGKKLKKKRNQSNKFKNTYKERITNQTLDTINDDIKKEIKDVSKRWALENSKSFDEFKREDSAIHRLLESFNKLGLLITIIRIDNKACAFSISEVLEDGFAICHFEKAIKGYEGIYPYVISVAANDLKIRGCEVVNWEQDLGLSGLRASKLSYYPVSFLKKYSISNR